jgi:hypothetical protein
LQKKTNNITEIRNLNSGTEPARSKSLHQIEVKAPYTTTIIIMTKLQKRPHSHFSLSLSLSLCLVQTQMLSTKNSKPKLPNQEKTN